MALANCSMNPEALQLFVGHVPNPPFWATVSRQNAPGAKDNARLWGRAERLTIHGIAKLLCFFCSLAFWGHSFITSSDFGNCNPILSSICDLRCD